MFPFDVLNETQPEADIHLRSLLTGYINIYIYFFYLQNEITVLREQEKQKSYSL